MLEHYKMIIQMLHESLITGSLIDIFRDQIWFRRIAVPVELDLTTLSVTAGTLKELENCSFIELTLLDLQTNRWDFIPPSRRYKAQRNLKRGLRGFALIKDAQVLGDVWCVVPTSAGKRVLHSHLDMIGIQSTENSVYTFDMMIVSAYRGKHLAAPMQHALQSILKAEGYSRLYAFYWQDNIPAMWMHRTLRYKELPKRGISRFFFIKWFETLPVDDTPVTVTRQS